MYDILIISLELFETKTFGKYMHALETAALGALQGLVSKMCVYARAICRYFSILVVLSINALHNNQANLALV